MSNNSTVKCPNCNHEFQIGNALAQEIENEIRSKYLKRYNEDKQKIESEKAQLEKQAELIKQQSENQEKILGDSFDKFVGLLGMADNNRSSLCKLSKRDLRSQLTVR